MGAGAEVVEKNFKAPSAVKKKPIPPPRLYFFFFLRFGVAFASSVPAPTRAPGPVPPGVAEVPEQARDHGGDAWRDPAPVAPASPRVPFSSISGQQIRGRRGEKTSNWAFISNEEGEVRGPTGC